MKMRDFWPESKAIALVFCPTMTKFEIDLVWLQIEKWWKWGMFGQKKGYSLGILLKNDQIWNWLILIADWKVMKMRDAWPTKKAIALVFCSKMTKFEIDWFWLQIGWPKSKAIALVFCSKMTKFEIDWFWLQIEKWWKWAMSGRKVRL